MTADPLRALYRAVFKREVYNVGLVDAPIHRFLEPEFRPAIRWLPPLPSGAFVADPFAFDRDGRTQLVCEYFDYREANGRIVTADLGASGTGPFRDAIVAPVHLSYPFTFSHEGRQYCMPESSRAGELAVYQLDCASGAWAKAAVVLAVDAVDPSLVRFAERWWLFGGLKHSGGTELHVWHAASPLGPWTPHRSNPVKRDPGSSRPGGTPFVHEGRLYRPAQDCAGGYGRRVVINEVTALSVDAFEERVVAAVAPDPRGPWPDGLHTLSAAGSLTLLDGKREQFVAAAVARSARNVIRRIAGAKRLGDP